MLNYNLEKEIDDRTFYSAFQILHSHYDVMSYKGKIYDEFDYQYLGVVYNYKLYDKYNKEIKPMINEDIILTEVLKLKLNLSNEINYFDENYDLNKTKILDNESRKTKVCSIKITSIEYYFVTCNNENSKITNKEFKEAIEENIEKVSTDYILPCADGVCFMNNLNEGMNCG